MTRTQLIRNLKIGIIVLAALIIASYGAWRSLDYARGPVITVFQPIDGSMIASSTAEIIGRADRVNDLTINGRPISLDEQGNFKETLIVFPGVNIITLDAKDQFGRSTEKQIEVVR
jgi:hypothetical protein